RRLAVTDDYAFQKAQVYPNPVEDMLYVKHVSDLKLIKVYNHLGQQVLQNNQERIDVSGLPSGIYFLQIHAGSITETKKFIKK
ncbi:T9SS type A sorting domain-containing protein, partial [Flavivirga aquimarina]